MKDFRNFEGEYRHQKEFVEAFLQNNPRPLGVKALEFAKTIHEGQRRKDGSPYIVHLFEVVYYLILIEFDDDISISTAFVHDGPEDERTTHEDICEQLTGVVSRLVFYLTNPKKGMTLEEFAEHLKNVFEEIRSLVIKVIDRVANMKRSMIGFFDKKALTRYCDEGEYVFVPMLEGFIAVIEDPKLLDPKYCEYYGQYAKSLRLLRSFLKGFVQAGREHIKIMEKNEVLEIKVRELEEKLNNLIDYEP